MRVVIRGTVDGGPGLELAHDQYSYAGKFRMTTTGKALALADTETETATDTENKTDLLGAIAFNRDRTDDTTVRFRYITVRAEDRARGIGPRLAAATADHLLESVERVVIAVNNPYAYHAMYKAGFGYTGEHTGLAEHVLETPSSRDTTAYQNGLKAFTDRSDLSPAEHAFIDRHSTGLPPARVTVPPVIVR